MQRTAILTATLVAFMAFAGTVRAADKADPTGTWKWSTKVGDQTRETTLKLKLEGDVLTGTISGRNNTENKIEDGKFKDGEVTFSVTRERNGQKSTTTYKAKVDGDTLKGKSEGTRNGQAFSRDFEAKREKA